MSMRLSKLIFAALAALLMIILASGRAHGCGCFGSTTCTVGGDFCPGSSISFEDCVCDCCNACLNCAQVFGGCGANDIQEAPSTFDVPPFNVVNEPITPSTVNNSYILFDPCVEPVLPEGLTLTQDATTLNWVLSGTPTQVQPSRQHIIIFKGPTSNFLTRMVINIKVTGPRPTTKTVVSQDGRCGTFGDVTYVCREGSCCSAFGWCGATPAHCDNQQQQQQQQQ